MLRRRHLFPDEYTVTSQPDNGPWKAGELHRDDFNWYIINTQTGAFKKIGPVSRGHGVNYFDRAVAEAERRNDAITNALVAEHESAEHRAYIESLHNNPKSWED